VNIAVHFIRAGSNLILSYSFERFPIYSLFSGKGEGARYREKREKRKESLEL